MKKKQLRKKLKKQKAAVEELRSISRVFAIGLATIEGNSKDAFAKKIAAISLEFIKGTVLKRASFVR